jgi:hypothetical protein
MTTCAYARSSINISGTGRALLEDERVRAAISGFDVDCNELQGSTGLSCRF